MGIELKPGMDPAIIYRRNYGAKPIAESKLFWKTTGLQETGELKITGAGLQEILSPYARNKADLERLMIAYRDIELATRPVKPKKVKFAGQWLTVPGKPIKGTKAELSLEVIDKIRLKYGDEKFNKLLEVAREIRDWEDRVFLQPLVEVGALSPEQRETIVASNQFYIPYRRVIEELEEYGSVRKSANLLQPGKFPIQKIKGSERFIKEPFEEIINMAYRITDFVERQRTLNAITNLRHLSPDIAREIREVPSGSVLPKISVFENGQRKYFTVPKDLYQAVKGLDVSDLGTLWRLLGIPVVILFVIK